MTRHPLTFEEAETLLAEGDQIHTFVEALTNAGPVLLGAEWDRDDVLNMLRYEASRGNVELAGEFAATMGHGVVVLRTRDDSGPHPPLFLETNDALGAMEEIFRLTRRDPARRSCDGEADAVSSPREDTRCESSE